MAKEYARLRTRTAMIIALLVGLFAYTIPLYAGNDVEYQMEEKTTIRIPVVGKITTTTSTYLSGCKIRETTRVRSHNPLIKTMTESDGKIGETQLTDLCDQVQWQMDDETGEYRKVSFAEIREKQREYMEEDEVQIDMELDQNDIDDLPEMSHKILPGKKNVNGFSCKEVLTKVYSDNLHRPIEIREFYADQSKEVEKITKAREEIHDELEYADDHFEGVPDLIKQIYKAMTDDQEWVRPDGEVVMLKVEMLDKERDPIFTMTYEVLKAEKATYQPDHFTLQ